MDDSFCVMLLMVAGSVFLTYQHVMLFLIEQSIQIQVAISYFPSRLHSGQ